MKNLIFVIISILLISCKNDSKNKSQEIADEPELLITEEVEKLAADFMFTEGPAVDAEGNVYFTDIPDNKIFKWTTKDSLETFKGNSGGANGLYFDKKGNLLICEGQKGQISSISPEGEYETIATEYNGKRFNQPNDIWADTIGGAYFTDPKYSDDQKLPQESMQVYYINPDRTEVIRVTEDLVKPNGLIGTPDGKMLYIADPGTGKTYKYSIEEDGSLSNKSLFTDSGSDGMTIDEDGNVYLTTQGEMAIDIYSPESKLIKSIEIPEQPSNVSFGGKDLTDLYITARTSLYRVGVNQKGVN